MQASGGNATVMLIERKSIRGARLENQQALYPLITDWLISKSKREWYKGKSCLVRKSLPLFSSSLSAIAFHKKMASY